MSALNNFSHLCSWPIHDLFVSSLLVTCRGESVLCKTGLEVKEASLAMGKDFEGGHFSGGLERRSESYVLQLDSYTQVQQPRWPLLLYIILLAEP